MLSTKSPVLRINIDQHCDVILSDNGIVLYSQWIWGIKLHTICSITQPVTYASIWPTINRSGIHHEIQMPFRSEFTEQSDQWQYWISTHYSKQANTYYVAWLHQQLKTNYRLWMVFTRIICCIWYFSWCLSTRIPFDIIIAVERSTRAKQFMIELKCAYFNRFYSILSLFNLNCAIDAAIEFIFTSAQALNLNSRHFVRPDRLFSSSFC